MLNSDVVSVGLDLVGFLLDGDGTMTGYEMALAGRKVVGFYCGNKKVFSEVGDCG